MQNLKIKDRTYHYSIKIIEFLDRLPKDSSSNVIVNQLVRSATSVGANIVEAQACNTRKDFTNFMHHSLKSANESLYWLGLLRDAKKISNSDLNYLFQETKELSNILGSSLLSLKGKN